ncbi:hypothetical protein AYL99_08909 [Fonsecaea erecta]|uniref:PWI domain-containing protein n=1 Tax=Fonsecaea erecta TaxID=1367422 RepID=A0A178ZAJ4_9EURO|nr:hypothetical protein AYL99_08909 [Fonsecaea erecta]OAP56797.1 hypothetical protein AYL99_08909 [Fonsecaea erecta]
MATAVDQKLLRQTKFPPEFNQKVDMKKVNIEVMKKWIAGKISEILGSEDDVVIELCFNLLEGSRFPDIKALQISLTGFLDKDTPKFCKELWNLCLSAQSNPQGVPKELLEAKKSTPRKPLWKLKIKETRNKLRSERSTPFDSVNGQTVAVVAVVVVVVADEDTTADLRDTQDPLRVAEDLRTEALHRVGRLTHMFLGSEAEVVETRVEDKTTATKPDGLQSKSQPEPQAATIPSRSLIFIIPVKIKIAGPTEGLQKGGRNARDVRRLSRSPDEYNSRRRDSRSRSRSRRLHHKRRMSLQRYEPAARRRRNTSSGDSSPEAKRRRRDASDDEVMRDSPGKQSVEKHGEGDSD